MFDLRFIDGNPLNCDCKLRWFKTLPRNLGAITCTAPTNLNGQNLVSLPDDQLVCGKLYKTDVMCVHSF